MADAWLRWYVGTVQDGKMRAVARNARVTVRDVIAVWSLLLEEAAHPEHRGVCTRNEDYIAAVLDFEDGVVEAVLGAMQDVGMVRVAPLDIRVTHWNDRQYETDKTDATNADRQRRWRERKKSETSPSLHNGTVTAAKRPDTETDTEKKVTPLRPPSEKRGERLAPDWRPSPDDEAVAVALGLDPQEIADGFRDFWLAKPGAGACKLDWAATWRNWCRTEAQRRARRPAVAGGSGGNGGHAAAWRAAAARVRGADPVSR